MDMTPRSVVSVYGLKPGQNRPKRLGEGSLIDGQLVLVTGPLSDKLAGDDPPSVLRVGIGSNQSEPTVEVIEVAQTLRSVKTDVGRLWALELAEPSVAPLDPFDLAELSKTSAAAAGGGMAARRFFCSLWPNASFC